MCFFPILFSKTCTPFLYLIVNISGKVFWYFGKKNIQDKEAEAHAVVL